MTSVNAAPGLKGPDENRGKSSFGQRVLEGLRSSAGALALTLGFAVVTICALIAFGALAANQQLANSSLRAILRMCTAFTGGYLVAAAFLVKKVDWEDGGAGQRLWQVGQVLAAVTVLFSAAELFVYLARDGSDPLTALGSLPGLGHLLNAGLTLMVVLTASSTSDQPHARIAAVIAVAAATPLTLTAYDLQLGEWALRVAHLAAATLYVGTLAAVLNLWWFGWYYDRASKSETSNGASESDELRLPGAGNAEDEMRSRKVDARDPEVQASDRTKRKRCANQETYRVLIDAASTYSSLALVAFLLLLVSGLGLGFEKSGVDVRNLWDPTWGRLLLLKAGITVTVLFMLGWAHRRFFLPTLRQGEPGPFMIAAIIECLLVMAFVTAAGSTMAVQPSWPAP